MRILVALNPLCIHLFKYRFFGLCVERGRRLVQNNDWSVTEESSRQRHALPFAS